MKKPSKMEGFVLEIFGKCPDIATCGVDIGVCQRVNAVLKKVIKNCK
jgi:hypothetical protein